MAHVRIAAALALALCILAATSSAAQRPGDASLQLRVIGVDTGQPLAGAHVTFPDLALFWITDASGVARVTGIPPGEHRFEVTLLGYGTESASLDFEAGAVAEGEVTLTRRPIELAGVTVTADRVRYSATLDRQGYYDRAEKGIGHHLDSFDIERMHAFRPSDVFRPLAGVRMRTTTLGDPLITFARCGVLSPDAMTEAVERGETFLGPEVYLDGVRWNGRLNDLEVDWIEAIEVYTGPSQVPIQYTRTSDTCGVVLIWTRR